MTSKESRPLDEAWEAWGRGEARCPFCIDMPWEEFQAMCDCSRARFEATGNQLSIEVIGHPESVTPVIPMQESK